MGYRKKFRSRKGSKHSRKRRLKGYRSARGGIRI